MNIASENHENVPQMVKYRLQWKKKQLLGFVPSLELQSFPHQERSGMVLDVIEHGVVLEVSWFHKA